MAAAIKALNARIRSNPYTDYFCSTHFWGPISNFGIPLAAIMDALNKEPEFISGRMTFGLSCYSAVFMRYAMAVTPKNYLLFACHFINFGSQLTQGYRFVNYYNFGGQEAALQAKAQAEAGAASIVSQAKAGFKAAEEKTKEGISKVTGK